MSFEYTFDKAITKAAAFNAYLRARTPNFNGVVNSPSQVTIFTTQELSEQDRSKLQSDIEAYIDPEYWLVLDHTESIPFTSSVSSGSSPFVIQSYIESPPNTNDGTVCDSIKTIIEYSTSDVTVFSNWDVNTHPLTATFDIYCLSYNNVVVSVDINLNEVGQKWKDDANNGKTGPAIYWKSLQLVGLKDKYPVDADCIRQYRISLSDTNISAKMNCLQKLFYVVE